MARRSKEARRVRLPVAAIKALEALYARVPSLHCKGYCIGACDPIANPSSELERDRMTARGGRVPLAMTPETLRTLTPCNYLADGRCSVYDVRPLICRLWGAVEGLPCHWGCLPEGGRLTEAHAAEVFAAITAAAKKFPKPEPAKK